MPLEIMQWNPEIDLGILGEAFETFPEVLDMLDAGRRDFSKTLGVAYRMGPLVKLTPVRPNIPDMDVLPWPAWDLFPLDIYFKNSQLLFSEEAFTSKRRIDVNGSLGCGLICRYCWHLGTTGDMVIEADEHGNNDVRFTYGRNIRYHSAGYLTKMVRHLYDHYQIDFASFIDENMMTMDASSGRTWIRELCQAWIASGLQPSCRRDRGAPSRAAFLWSRWRASAVSRLRHSHRAVPSPLRVRPTRSPAEGHLRPRVARAASPRDPPKAWPLRPFRPSP
jgi:hypothetical protein